MMRIPESILAILTPATNVLGRFLRLLGQLCVALFLIWVVYDGLLVHSDWLRIAAESIGDTLLASNLPAPASDILSSYIRIHEELFLSLCQTLYMVFFSTLFSFVIGFFLAAVMIITGPHGLRPVPSIYAALDFCVDILRSLPFIILIITIMPITRMVMGIAIGTTATIMPLTVAAAPFAARIIEANFLEVDKGVVEAARSFGAGLGQIIFRVMLPEALPAIVLNVAVLAIALIGYSAMAGTVGGGGLGDLAYRLGYNRFQNDVSLWCIGVLVILVRGIQMVGNYAYRRLR